MSKIIALARLWPNLFFYFSCLIKGSFDFYSLLDLRLIKNMKRTKKVTFARGKLQTKARQFSSIVFFFKFWIIWGSNLTNPSFWFSTVILNERRSMVFTNPHFELTLAIFERKTFFYLGWSRSEDLGHIKRLDLHFPWPLWAIKLSIGFNGFLLESFIA